MAKFVLTAQLQLQAPTNTRQVVNQIRQQLTNQGVKIPIEVEGARKAKDQIKSVTDETKKATNAAQALGKSFGLAVKRFAAFTVASRAVSLFTNSLANAVEDAIEFQREIIKISQVTGDSVKQLRGLKKTITDLSTGLGVVSKDLLAVTRILSQAGFRGSELDVALTALAKTTLAPTFDDITQTAEGAVAILSQFGKGVGALESQLGSINRVAGQFAVESGDLIGAVRRFGGVFKSAGGDLNELIALFTSVRQTTRESAESISTGLRTIFTRIQRPETIQFLRQFGVELETVDGRFKGPLEATRLLGDALANLPQGDLKFISIAEELGGFRQIGKVIPLLQQTAVTERALSEARGENNSLTEDAAKQQAALATQITKVKEEFQALVRSIAESGSFQILISGSLKLASALIKVVDAVKPLIPLLATLGTIKLAQGLGGFFAGAGKTISNIQSKNLGGTVQKFASGGFVPGSGNRDTVPAMLTPGEFVIRKSSAQKLGSGTLSAMNENRFNVGGKVGQGISKEKNIGVAVSDVLGGDSPGDIIRQDVSVPIFATAKNKSVLSTNPGFGPLSSKTLLTRFGVQDGPNAASFIANTRKRKDLKGEDPKVPYSELTDIAEDLTGIKTSKKVKAIIEGATQNDLNAFEGILNETAKDAISSTATQFAGTLGGSISSVEFAENFSIDRATRGKLFEDVIDALQNVPVQGAAKDARIPFDLTNGIKERGTLFSEIANSRARYVEIKSEEKKAKSNAELEKKLRNQIATELYNDPAFSRAVDKRSEAVAKGLNRGGPVGTGTDTVPALLTPGEFVVNKASAQSIGYGNLKSMNRDGVQKFAKGGTVGVQRFAGGGGVLGGGAASAGVVIGLAQAGIQQFGDTSEKASDQMFKTTVGLQSFLNTLLGIGIIVKAFQVARNSINNWEQSVEKSTQAVEQNTVAEQRDTQQIRSDGGPSTSQREGPLTKAQAEASDAFTGDSAARQARGVRGSIGSLIPGTQANFARNEEKIRAIQNDPRKLVADEKVKRGKESVSTNKKALESAEKAVLASAKRNIAIRKEVNDRLKLVLDAKKRQAVAERKVAAGTQVIDQYTQARGTLERSIQNTRKKQEVAIEKSLAAEQRSLQIQKRLEDLSRAAKNPRGKDGKFQDPSAPGGGKPLSDRDAAKQVALLKAELNQVYDAARTSTKQLDVYSKSIDGNEKSLKEIDKTEKRVRSNQKANTKELKDATKRATTASTKYRGAIRAKALAEKTATVVAGKLITATKAFTRSQKKLEGSLKASTQQALRLERAESKLARSRSIRSGLKKGAAGFAKAGAGITAGLAIASTIAAQLGSFIQQTSERTANKQQDLGNVRESARAAEAGAFAEGISEVFSITGLIAAATGGLPTLFEQIKDSIKFAGANRAADTFKGVSSTASKGLIEGGEFRTGDNAVDFAAATAKLSDAASEARAPLLRLAEGSKKRKELEDDISSSLKKNISDYVANGASLEAASNAAIRFAGGNSKLEAEYTKLASTLINAREAQQQLADANFESLKITSAFGAATSAVDVFTNGLATGSDALTGYIKELEGAQGLIGVDVSEALDGIGQELLKSASGTGVEAAVRGQLDTATTASSFLQDLGGRLSNTKLDRSSKSGAQSDLRSAVNESLQGVPLELQSQIRAIAGSQIDSITNDNFQQTDISEFIGKIASETQKLYGGLVQGAKLQAAHNQKISGLYLEREKIESDAVSALNKAIDAQFVAAKAFEDFGGEALTSDQAIGGRLAQFNNVGGLAGVGLRTGDASDISRVAGEIANVFNTQQNAALQDISNRVAGGGPGVFAGPGGIQKDKRDEAKRASDQLITFTKQRIALLKEELTIVQAKNREEKSALDKLISGDIEGFIKGQAAAGAGAALSTGSQGLTGLFSSSALGAGFKSLQDQGLGDRQLNRAANLTLGGFGIADSGAAGVLSGTTPEGQAIKAEGRELARTFGDIATQGADFASSEISIKDATIAASRVIFQSELENVSLRNNPDFKSRGGPIYANRGMFVPRGTDTVPAMLTPGEFVVNRSAVQRGNNMQILRAMNSQGGASSPSHMSGGGRVHYQTGGVVEGINGAFADSLPQLRNVFADFSSAVDRLANTQFSVKLDTTNVNVNLNGASFLATLKEDIKKELLGEVAREIGKAKQNSSGDMELRKTVL